MTAAAVFALLLWRPWHTPTADELLGPPPHYFEPPEPKPLVTCIIEDLTVPDAVTAVAQAADTVVEANWGAMYLPRDGGERRVTMYLRDVPVRAALELVIQQSAASWLKVAHGSVRWRIDDTSYAIRQELSWSYDVRELLAPHVLAHTELPPMTEQLHQMLRGDTTGGSRFVGSYGNDERVANAGDALMEVLRDSIDQENWYDRGGLLYSGGVFQGILHLAASPEVHIRAHRLLYQLWLGLEDRLPPEAPSLALTTALATLDKPLPTIAPGLTLKALPRHLHEVTGLSVAVDWRALGITSDRSTTMPPGPLTARSLLDSCFPPIDAPHRPEWYVTDEGVIIISPRPAYPHVRPVVYALGDDFDPPPVDSPAAQSAEPPVNEVLRQIADAQLSPFVFVYGRAIVVNTTADGHLNVAREIRRLRAEARR